MRDRLILKLNSGNVRAFEQIMGKYSKYVFSIAKNHAKGLLTREDLEEVVEDTFVALWRARESINANQQLMPYIAAIAKNAAKNHLRCVGNATGTQQSRQVEGGYMRVETVSDILDAADKLGKKQYEVFIRYYFYGETLGEISEGMRLSDPDVRTSLHRARESIKVYLSERGYSDEIV